MNKRSALLVAAGLILTLVVGGLAVAIGLTGPSVSSAVPRSGRSAVEPVVQTVRRTVTVHETADQATGAVVQLAASTASAAPSTGDDDPGEIEDHGDDDRGHEADDRDDGHEGETDDD